MHKIYSVITLQIYFQSGKRGSGPGVETWYHGLQQVYQFQLSATRWPKISAIYFIPSTNFPGK